MLFSHEPLKRDLRNARRILWWGLAIGVLYQTLASFGFTPDIYALVLTGAATLSVLFSYIAFLGFSRLAKHFHSMRLFWLLVASFIIGAFIAVIDVIDKLTFYGTYDPYRDLLGAVEALTQAAIMFGYGYLIMDLPAKKFGGILFRARVYNILLALITPLIIYVNSTQPTVAILVGFSSLASLASLVLIVVTTAIDYKIAGIALRLVGGVLPHTAPLPQPVHDHTS